MTEQINWRAKQPSQVACFSEDLKCWGAWDTTCGHKARDITPPIAWRRETWKEEVLDDLPGVMGWSAHRLFPEHRHILNWTEPSGTNALKTTCIRACTQMKRTSTRWCLTFLVIPPPLSSLLPGSGQRAWRWVVVRWALQDLVWLHGRGGVPEATWHGVGRRVHVGGGGWGGVAISGCGGGQDNCGLGVCCRDFSCCWDVWEVSYLGQSHQQENRLIQLSLCVCVCVIILFFKSVSLWTAH